MYIGPSDVLVCPYLLCVSVSYDAIVHSYYLEIHTLTSPNAVLSFLGEAEYLQLLDTGVWVPRLVENVIT